MRPSALPVVASNRAIPAQIGCARSLLVGILLVAIPGRKSVLPWYPTWRTPPSRLVDEPSLVLVCPSRLLHTVIQFPFNSLDFSQSYSVVPRVFIRHTYDWSTAVDDTLLPHFSLVDDCSIIPDPLPLRVRFPSPNRLSHPTVSNPLSHPLMHSADTTLQPANKCLFVFYLLPPPHVTSLLYSPTHSLGFPRTPT